MILSYIKGILKEPKLIAYLSLVFLGIIGSSIFIILGIVRINTGLFGLISYDSALFTYASRGVWFIIYALIFLVMSVYHLGSFVGFLKGHHKGILVDTDEIMKEVEEELEEEYKEKLKRKHKK